MPRDRRRPLRICLLTDVFPPRCGGSGWSTYYLGKALAGLGHDVMALRPRFGLKVRRPALRQVSYGGMRVEEVLVPQSPFPLQKTSLARAWEERVATRLLAKRAARLAISGNAEILHGQHAISGVAASLSARSAQSKGASAVSVCTVRDYWPLCPNSTRLFCDRDGRTFECPECHHISGYLECIRAGAALPSLGTAPALARWLRTRRLAAELERAGTVIAVSAYVLQELARSRRVSVDRLVRVPNLVDLPSVDRALVSPWTLKDISPEAPFLLFAGKLDLNKGGQMLPSLVERSGVHLPVLLAGDGPLKVSIAREAEARGLDFRFVDWLDNDAVLQLMHRARALLFPSAWQEPLSRVLLEGCAAGAAIVALNTGGTADIIDHVENGWLARDEESFAHGLQRVVSDDGLNARLRAGARHTADEVFAAPVVSAQVEALYSDLLEHAARGGVP